MTCAPTVHSLPYGSLSGAKAGATSSSESRIGGTFPTCSTVNVATSSTTSPSTHGTKSARPHYSEGACDGGMNLSRLASCHWSET